MKQTVILLLLLASLWARAAQAQVVEVRKSALPTGAATEAGNLATIAGAVSAAKLQVNVSQVGGTAVYVDPCAGQWSQTKINAVTATTTVLIPGAASKKTYVCGVTVNQGGTGNWNFIEGTTGGTCGSGTAALYGGLTAATGFVGTAQFGISWGYAGRMVMATATNQNDVCFVTSAAVQVSGIIWWVQQ